MRKSILAACTTLLMFCACASHKAVTDYGYSVNSFKGMTHDTMTVQQVDSMIEVDALPVLAKWQSNTFSDASTGLEYKYYTLFKKNSGIVYTVKELKAGAVYYTVKKGVGTAK